MPLSTNNYAALPMTNVEQGIRTELATILGPGANVAAYVRSGGAMTYDAPGIKKNLVATLDAGLARCRSDSTNMAAGYGDVVVVLPGHAENISSADQMSSLVPGTRIVGLGDGTSRPTFTWTAAAATFLFDQANTRLYNCRLIMATTANNSVTVTAPLTVSAAGCAIKGCYIDIGGDANDNVGQAIITTADADDLEIEANTIVGATAATCETVINVVGADRLRLVNNYISCATSAVAVGVVRCETTASTNVLIYGNYLANNVASSEEALTLMAGVTGFMDWNNLAVLDDASIALDAVGNITMGAHNYLANTVGERGVQLGTESAAT